MKKITLFSAFLLCASMQANSAIITWDSVTNASGNASDVLSVGTLHDSATSYNSDVLVNGQLFNRDLGLSGGTVSYNNSGITFSNVQSNANYGALPGSGWDSEYLKLVDQGSWRGNGGDLKINISNLISGNNYLVQIWNPYWNTNWTTEYKDEFGNSSGLLKHGLSSAAILPQFVVGRFTADASTQTISAFGPTYAVVGSIQVRDVPEPSTLAILALGIIGLGAARFKK